MSGAMTGEVHEGVDPFATPLEARDPVRQFRGRLAVPVTVITSGGGDDRTGMTVSSLVVAEGEPGHVQFLAAPTADLVDVIGATRRFVVHILETDHRGVAEIFAGQRPSPGGLFATVAYQDGPWGPVLLDVRNRAFCSAARSDEIGYSLLVTAAIDAIEIGTLDDPLLYFRGAYRRL
jgi:flavin reductase (DIM6/NTAB) family NADH-FMN oxidoreductase RutF